MQKWCNWLIAIALICLLFVAIPISYSGGKQKEKLMQPLFDEYIKEFNKSYKEDPAEYQARFNHFMASMDEIEQLNAASRGPEGQRARYGLTRLSDMSKSEYKEVHLSDEKMTNPPHHYGRSWRHNRDNNAGGSGHNVISRAKRAALPLKFDWRTKGVIGPVRSQGLCGACWAFSTIGAAETMNAIKTGKLETLSVQEVIDCAGLGNSGCLGGDVCLLLQWLVMTDTAIEKDSEYPLRLTDGLCRLKKNATGVHVATFTCDELEINFTGVHVDTYLTFACGDFVGAEDKILQAIATHGPVAVAVNALTWQNYLGGVIQFHCSGAPADLNHAVELVGYDLTGEVPYYIAKNSWGSLFGNSGYIHLAVGSNMCGLANEVATVDVK